MVEPTGPSTSGMRQLIEQLRGPRHVQLELPLEGIPSSRTSRLFKSAREFATGFGPRLGSKLLMRVGVPMVAATTPAVVRMLDRGMEDDWLANLAVGSGLGGAWGAMVGALIPVNSGGVRIPRARSVGLGAASGILLAPAVALVSKAVTDWATSPLRTDADAGENAGADAPVDSGSEVEGVG